MKPKRKRITAICPAPPGWWAVYSWENADELCVDRVAVWVVVEEDGVTAGDVICSVESVDLQGEGALGWPCSESSNFSGFTYMPECETPDEVTLRLALQKATD